MPVFLASIFLAGCASTDYVGKTYPETTNVDVFFSAEDVEREYEVMGQAKTEGGEYMSFESMQKQLVKDAMKRGADAIIIEGLDTVVLATTTSTQGESTSKSGKSGEKTGYTEYSSTSDIREKVITSRLLKYRD